MSLQAAPVVTYNQRAGAGARRGASVQRPATAVRRSHSTCYYYYIIISQTATDTATVTIEGELETVRTLWNGTNFNDRE